VCLDAARSQWCRRLRIGLDCSVECFVIEWECQGTTHMTVRDQRKEISTTKTPITHIPWSRRAACIVAFFWACTAQAEDSPGVLPSRWVTGLPSVVLPGKHNAVDPVVLRASSGALLVAAESRGANESAILLSRNADDGST